LLRMSAAVCRTYGACPIRSVFPALPGWAKLCRASRALSERSTNGMSMKARHRTVRLILAIKCISRHWMPVPILGYEIGARYGQQLLSVNRAQPSEEIRNFLCAGRPLGDEPGDHTLVFGDLDFFAFVEQALDLFEGVTKVAD